jgi:hypothetical protein
MLGAVTAVKKRNRNPLDDNWKDVQNKKYVITNSCYLEGSLALFTPTNAEKALKSYNSSNNSYKKTESKNNYLSSINLNNNLDLDLVIL